MALPPHAAQPLSRTGIAFFSSLCAGTFGLGVWQTQRYLDKIDKLEDRTQQLQMDPVIVARHQQQPLAHLQRIQVSGSFQHEYEFYIGPRGSPTAQSGSAGVSPQGYFVWTPLLLLDDEKEASDKSEASAAQQRVLLINRGWIPKTWVDGSSSPAHTKSRQNGSNSNSKVPSWTRPTGTVSLMTVQAPIESPRFLVPQHTHIQNRKLFWLDRPAMMALGGVPMLDEDSAEETTNVLMLTEINEYTADGENNYPIRPGLDQIGLPRVSPATHVGYAVTWYGLAAAGVVMTRKLILKR